MSSPCREDVAGIHGHWDRVVDPLVRGGLADSRRRILTLKIFQFLPRNYLGLEAAPWLDCRLEVAH